MDGVLGDMHIFVDWLLLSSFDRGFSIPDLRHFCLDAYHVDGDLLRNWSILLRQYNTVPSTAILDL